MLVTNIEQEKGSKIPFSTTTLTLVYGELEYIRSVFGTDAVTRDMIIKYFEEARKNWPKATYGRKMSWEELKCWCIAQDIGRLHYYVPPGTLDVFFKNPKHLFLFNLKFGL